MSLLTSSLQYDQYTILVVDDNPTNLTVICEYLEQYGFELMVASNGLTALERIEFTQPDLILLDIMMPELDGYETAKRLKENPKTQAIPIIFMTALAGTEDKVKGFAAGAVDYITKPFQHEEVFLRVTTHLKLQDLNRRLQHKNGLLELTHLIGQKIASTLDFAPLLTEIVQSIQQEFCYYFVSLWLYDSTHQTLTLTASAGDNHPPQFLVGKRFFWHQPAGILLTAAHQQTTLLANNTTQHDLYLPEPQLPLTQAELALPLVFQQTLFGVLDIQCQYENKISAEDAIVLQTLSNYITIALRNAQLYQQVQHFNQELEQEITKRIQDVKQAYTLLEKIHNSKSNFIEVAAHELRTPLTIIRGYTQLLKHVEDNPEQLKSLTEGIIQGQERLSVVVNNMLDVARIDSQQLKLVTEPTQLNLILQSVEAEYKTALQERNIALTMALPPLPLLMIDPQLMNKAFSHLLGNAIKYTPDGKAIEVKGETIEEKGQKFIFILIRDQGIGIDPQYHHLIFEKFFQTGPTNLHSSGRTKFKGGGSGLGLAIVKGIIEAHNGKIWVESPGHNEETFPGTTIKLLLPWV